MNETSSGPRILDIPAGWTLPALGKRVVPPGGTVRSDERIDTVTTWDTAAGDLAALDVVVERGAGATANWILRIDGTSSEFAPAGRGVPVELRDLLLGLRAGAALRAVGKTAVAGIVHRIVDADGVELGVIAVVESVRDAGPAERHVEVTGWDEFADAAVRRLAKSDAVERPVRGASSGADTERGSVGAALVAYLRAQRRAVLRADLDLRRGDDSVHAFRVAIRRIRSALRVVTVADPDRVAALDAELRWLSLALGAVRDLEVLRDHLDESFAALAGRDDLDLAATARAITSDLDEREARARTELTAVLAGRRYFAVVKALRSWCEEPPFDAAADEPEKRLARYVRKAAKDLDRRLSGASGSAEKLHRARKAAKRARYVASFAGRSAGPHGRDVVRHAKALQNGLGDHQDSVLAAEFVARTAATAQGAAAFGCGVLWSYEQDRAAKALRTARKSF